VVADALKELEHAEPGHKLEAWKHLREAYLDVARPEIAKMREGMHPDGTPRGSGAGDPPSGPPSNVAPQK
jgi:hypothetical protein